MRKKIVVLGSTGSIGENALRVIRANPDRFEVAALAAGRNWERLAEQAREFSPQLVSITEPENAGRLREAVPEGVSVLSGDEGLQAAAGAGADVLVSALVGAAGLSPTLAAIEAGASIALANKEVLVMAGELVTSRARRMNVPILPIDSEHAGVAQAMGDRSGEVRRIVLTASGGPFRTLPLESLCDVPPQEALCHPTWKMGPKITIDSATLMNKGLEIIEARWLFGLPPDRVDVLVHPESIVHALVEFVDGSVLAQMSVPDMRISISQALCHPERIPTQVPSLDLAGMGPLHFEEPDTVRFPCLAHARRALAEGGTAPAVLNAAGEVAVAAYLEKRIGFMEIPALVGAALEAHKNGPARELGAVLEADGWARGFAASHLGGLKSKVGP
ncbi:MAG: 1-deoxy-D-xylulose-5-phosphate reductoisomerase [bacterium]